MTRSIARVASPQPGACCSACLGPLRIERRGRWCSEACRVWAHRHPGEVRVIEPAPPPLAPRPCERCGEPFQPNFATARFCTRSCVGGHLSNQAAAARPTCVECDKPSRTRGRCKSHYNKWYYGPGGPGDQKNRYGDPEKRKARERAKTHLRKAVGRYADVTPEDERRMRDKAKRCPLCKVKLIKEPYLPTSKELDHMVPLNMGGTHTHGNVRIICRACNQARPKDGSDYLGPVTLWAQDQAVAATLVATRVRIKPTTTEPRPQPSCECGRLLYGGRCWTCNPNHPQRAPTYVPAASLTYAQKRDRTRQAARMRAEGKSWWEIADTLGYGRESSALQAVRDYRPDPPVVLSLVLIPNPPVAQVPAPSVPGKPIRRRRTTPPPLPARVRSLRGLW